MKSDKYYVTMTDTFLSGWGLAQNKTNKFIVECQSYEQAVTIERNAKKRNEMKYVRICTKKPYYPPSVLESWKTYDELGNIWKQ